MGEARRCLAAAAASRRLHGRWVRAPHGLAGRAVRHALAAVAEAERIWDTINGPNLAQNILPTRSRATLVLRKDRDHSVRYVRLRKL